MKSRGTSRSSTPSRFQRARCGERLCVDLSLFDFLRQAVQVLLRVFDTLPVATLPVANELPATLKNNILTTIKTNESLCARMNLPRAVGVLFRLVVADVADVDALRAPVWRAVRSLADKSGAGNGDADGDDEDEDEDDVVVAAATRDVAFNDNECAALARLVNVLKPLVVLVTTV